jgi:FeS assembly SUF system protein|tara:strand:- start:3 stop:374 length:372 start_codon:yes stop_codon:yes gene_type:complete
MPPAPEAGLAATAGEPIDPAVVKLAEKDAVVEALKTIHDPEIPVNIYDLGLIYDVAMSDDGNVAIAMTLTAPACPVAGEMPQWVADAAAGVEGVGKVEVELVWDPPWNLELMSDEAKVALDMW